MFFFKALKYVLKPTVFISLWWYIRKKWIDWWRLFLLLLSASCPKLVITSMREQQQQTASSKHQAPRSSSSFFFTQHKHNHSTRSLRINMDSTEEILPVRQSKKASKVSFETRALFSLKGPLSEKRVKSKGRFLRDIPLWIKASMHVEEVDDDELLPGLIDINAAAEPAWLLKLLVWKNTSIPLDRPLLVVISGNKVFRNTTCYSHLPWCLNS